MTKPMIQPVKFEWIKDALTEHGMKEAGLTFHFDPAVRYSTVDVEGGHRNKVRQDNNLIEELWMKLALKMEAGSPFQAPVLFMLNDGLFVYGLAHGNHRMRSYSFVHNDNAAFLKSARATFGAYVIDSPYTEDVEEYERLANNPNGESQARDYALINGVWLVQQRKLSLKVASQKSGISTTVISRKIAAEKEQQDIEKMGVETHNLTPSHFSRLASLKFESHKKHLATLANDSRISSEDLSREVAEIRKLRTEARGNEYIHDLDKRMRRERGGPKGAELPTVRRRRLFLKGLRQFEDLWRKGNEGKAIHSLTAVGIARQDTQVRQDVAKRIKDLIRIMQNAVQFNKRGRAK